MEQAELVVRGRVHGAHHRGGRLLKPVRRLGPLLATFALVAACSGNGSSSGSASLVPPALAGAPPAADSATTAGGSATTAAPVSVARYCARGVTASRTVYPDTDHVSVIAAAYSDIDAYVRSRLAGEPAPSSC